MYVRQSRPIPIVSRKTGCYSNAHNRDGSVQISQTLKRTKIKRGASSICDRAEENNIGKKMFELLLEHIRRHNKGDVVGE
jgi:hypothetical protein